MNSRMRALKCFRLMMGYFVVGVECVDNAELLLVGPTFAVLIWS